MRPRDILAANLKTLMAAKEDLARFPDITKASHGKLTNGTLDRIRRADAGVSVDRLEDLAEVFKLQPWQLLVEGLNPEALPRLADEAFVRRLKDILQMADATERNDDSDQHAHQLESQKRQSMNHALKKALDKGAGRAGGKTGPVSKPGTRKRA